MSVCMRVRVRLRLRVRVRVRGHLYCLCVNESACVRAFTMLTTSWLMM